MDDNIALRERIATLEADRARMLHVLGMTEEEWAARPADALPIPDIPEIPEIPDVLEIAPVQTGLDFGRMLVDTRARKALRRLESKCEVCKGGGFDDFGEPCKQCMEGPQQIIDAEVRPDGEFVRVQDCVEGQVYYFAAMGTVRDGCVFVRACFVGMDDSKKLRPYQFITNEDEHAERVWFDADEEVIEPQHGGVREVDHVEPGMAPVRVEAGETVEGVIDDDYEMSRREVMVGFMLTEEQERALDEIDDWLNEFDRPFLSLTGPAGTGKSTLLRAVVDRHPSFALCAMTGKAALRVRQLTGSPAGTLHATMYFPPQPGEDLVFTRLREAPAMVAVDECFAAEQKVFTETGWVEIGKIVNERQAVRVWSRNPATGNLELKQIVGWLKKPAPATMLRIDVGRTASKRNGRIICCTDNHKVLTPRGYVRAADLVVGDEVVVRGHGLTKEQKSILIGSILGDGSITRTSAARNSAQMKFMHGVDQIEYLNFKRAVFGGMASELSVHPSGFEGGKPVWSFAIDVTDDVTRVAQEVPHNGKVYKSGRQQWSPTDKFISWIDEQALATWFLDNGSLTTRELADGSFSYAASIHSERFNENDHDRFVAALMSRFGLVAKIQPTRGMFHLRFSKEETDRLLEIVRPYTPSCMAWKVGGSAVYSYAVTTQPDTTTANVRQIKTTRLGRGQSRSVSMAEQSWNVQCTSTKSELSEVDLAAILGLSIPALRARFYRGEPFAAYAYTVAGERRWHTSDIERLIAEKELRGKSLGKPVCVYDIEVADFHNYVAGNVIVSNCSMMAPQVFADLKRWGAEKILLAGDCYQLPPVITGQELKKFGEDFSVFSFVKGPALEIVMRNAGGVLRAATRVRETGEICTASDLDGPGQGYEFQRSADPVEQAVSEYVAGFVDGQPPDWLLITWRNSVRMRANRMVRERIGHGGPLPDEGEPVLIKRNGMFMNGEVVECGGFEEGPLLGADKDGLNGVQTLYMHVGARTGQEFTDSMRPRLLVTVTGGARDKGGEFFDGQAPWIPSYQRFHADLRRFNLILPTPITWAYAITAHSAQGHQAARTTVFLERGDPSSRNFCKPTTLPSGQIVSMKARWAYTATTRSTEYVKVIVGK